VLSGPPETIKRARTLRKEMTLPEILLWQELRKRPCGFKFRRQHPAGPYILDFFCHDAQLIVEVDGRGHELESRIEQDEARDAYFATRNLLTLRLPATDILKSIHDVVETIVTTCHERLPLHHATHGPPPPSGEDFTGAH
jgi:very-short-patch-repair endonuclease